MGAFLTFIIGGWFLCLIADLVVIALAAIFAIPFFIIFKIQRHGS